MKVFSCPVCQGPVYFENVSCLQCGTTLAYDISTDAFRADVVLCAQSQSVESCNWMVMGDGPFCRSCFIDTDHMATERRWPFQRSKRRALRQLARFHVDLDWSPLLRFDLRDGSVEGPITIGHQDGVITLDTAEADPARREQVRTSLGEPYRSPLGHVRHELGHWYWQAHLGNSFSIAEFRAVFGDESASYAE